MSAADLLAVVEVSYDARIICQAPGCGHSVYKRIHLVSQGGALQVLGSDCFSRLFGGGVRQRPQYGGSAGRVLTPEERGLLLDNTAQLIEQFKAEHDAILAEQLKAEHDRVLAAQRKPYWQTAVPQPRVSSPDLRPGFVAKPASASAHAPWPWMKPLTSMAYFALKDGTGWVRVQRTDGRQLLVPWPAFEGWDEALPAHIGAVDSTCGGYVLSNVVAAVAYLRSLSDWEKIGIWRDIAAEIAEHNKGRLV
jgi:hypothetical protein